jgi:genome maintenance exonuclease 1
MANAIIDQGIKPNVNEVWGMEVPLYYSGLYAGTTDCVGLWQGMPAILDFKQTNKPKKREWIDDYFLQLAAYSQAHNHMHGTEIKCGVILMCSAEFKYQEFVIESKEFEFWTQKWYDRLEQYYTQSLPAD